MSNTKKIDQQKRQKELEERKRLEEMLDELPESLNVLTVEAENILKKKKKVKLNYEEIKDDIERESTEIIETSASFYFEKEEIENETYIKEKLKIYKLTVSNLLFQMKTSEHAIIKLLEKIDEGSTHPREFEVLSSLQRAKMDIVKHLSSFMIVMENNLKDIRHDYIQKASEGRVANQLSLTEGDDTKSLEEGDEVGSIRARGTKNLIKSLREVADNIKEQDAEDVEDIDFEEKED